MGFSPRWQPRQWVDRMGETIWSKKFSGRDAARWLAASGGCGCADWADCTSTTRKTTRNDIRSAIWTTTALCVVIHAVVGPSGKANTSRDVPFLSCNFFLAISVESSPDGEVQAGEVQRHSILAAGLLRGRSTWMWSRPGSLCFANCAGSRKAAAVIY